MINGAFFLLGEVSVSKSEQEHYLSKRQVKGENTFKNTLPWPMTRECDNEMQVFFPLPACVMSHTHLYIDRRS